ncbi:TetR/AcrR family transcriptional regulator [Streptomyces sp. H10-C2]|uniref:TetR/AcrR family transcriptional regulator n=1 Tax=unclassified Streptomyces TaxID=2593676 RepID=UPI0024B88E64|nr:MULTISPECIES: TetR/AcrR family transcriptional regulator [unclassified Streptomyces]MDJ0346464.1 TetR/AcrR family transcriptional regulator [Streptomyces sp. PH10-H1]MDJ0374403.1 TetR/AcrR family transcriptional regulator [Streptomyces sp. H10-C2]
MSVPYELTGRREQKTRTRQALVAATRALLAEGSTPTVEEAAAAAGISRTTAYRYFPNQRTLLTAAHPEIRQQSLLPENPPTDPQARLDLVMQAFTRLTVEWEPQLRASLRLSLEPGADQPMLRHGRAIGWIEDALSPLREIHPGLDVHRLAVAIRSATGIEALIWLTDIAGLPRDQAAETMRWSAQAMLNATLAEAGSASR